MGVKRWLVLTVMNLSLSFIDVIVVYTVFACCTGKSSCVQLYRNVLLKIIFQFMCFTLHFREKDILSLNLLVTFSLFKLCCTKLTYH